MNLTPWFHTKSYLRFAEGQHRLLAFGFAMTFASSVGQTFFIGAFGPSIQREFALSHAEWGAIYMAGTLLSAAFLPWTGAQIDRLPLGDTLVIGAAVGEGGRHPPQHCFVGCFPTVDLACYAAHDPSVSCMTPMITTSLPHRLATEQPIQLLPSDVAEQLRIVDTIGSRQPGGNVAPQQPDRSSDAGRPYH